MFEDFLNFTYSQTTHKLRKIRNLINRMRGVEIPEIIEPLLQSLKNSVDRLDKAVQGIPEWLEDRRSRREEPVPPPQPNLPDLTITEIIPTNYDHYIDFAITIKNIGIANAGATQLKVIIPELLNRDMPVPALSPNESATLFTQYSFNPAQSEELKTFQAQVDPYQNIEESNENNNTLSTQVIIKGQYTPPPGKAYYIVHAHNPEGKEINSILGAYHFSYISIDGVNQGIKTASNEAEHGIPRVIDPGSYTIGAIFNGMTVEEPITLVAGETKEIIITFDRIDANFDFNIDNEVILSGTFNLFYPGNHFKTDSDILLDAPWHSEVSFTGIVNHPDGWAVGNYEDKVKYKITPTLFECDLLSSLNGTGHQWEVYNNRADLKAFISYLSDAPYPLTIDIPSRTDFNYWFPQQFITDEYPTIHIQDNIGNGIFLVRPDEVGGSFTYYALKGYYIDKDGISTDYHLTKLEFRYRRYTDTRVNTPGSSYIDGDFSGIDTKSGNGSAVIKLSSIPYDLEGTAI